MGAARDSSANQQKGNGNVVLPAAFSYRLVLNAIYSVTGAFVLVMALFAYIEVFNTENSANVTAALSSLFGIVGTLVGAYFGIKASSDAQDRSADTAQRAVSDQKDTAQRAVSDQKDIAQKAVSDQKDTAQKAVSDQKDTAQQAVDRAVAATSQTSPRAGGASPMKLALATLVPIAGGVGLIVLRRYLG
jgi:hypothetical protein